LPLDFSTYFGHNWGVSLGTRLIIGSFTLQHLLQTTGINLDKGGGINESLQFQDHFSEYKIVVYCGLNCEDIIFEGSVTSEKRVNLLYDEVKRHFHVITNLEVLCLSGSSVRVVVKAVDQVLHTSVGRHVQIAYPAHRALVPMFESLRVVQ